MPGMTWAAEGEVAEFATRNSRVWVWEATVASWELQQAEEGVLEDFWVPLEEGCALPSCCLSTA